MAVPAMTMPIATAATATAMTGTSAHVTPATQETIVNLHRAAASIATAIMFATTNVPTPALMATTIVMTTIRVVTMTAPATVVVEFHIAMSAFAQLLDVDIVSCAKSESSWPQSTP